MKIKTVEFAGAIGAPGQKPPGTLRQVAFSGRSNVGKSSLINRLTGRTRTQLARVSATPGKTQQINFFTVRAAGTRDGAADREFYLVDLPGYGYARVPHELRNAWRPLIESYLSRTDELAGVVQLIDARHGPTPEDIQMVQYLARMELPALFALTKIDKLKQSEREKQIRTTIRALGVDADQIVPFSAVTGEGADVLLESVGALLDEESHS